MESISIPEQYLNFLWSIFQQDMANLSHWWMWAFLAIPAVGYLLFFFARWCIITTPLWLPVFLALSSIRRFPGQQEKAGQVKGAAHKKTAAPENATPGKE